MKRFLMFAVVAVLLLGGCAAEKKLVKPEELNKMIEEAKAAIEQAKKDILDAKNAGAVELAKELLDAAESKLTVAEESFKKEDYEIAKNFAVKASEDAKLAKLKAQAAKAIEQAKADIASAKEVKAEEFAPDLMKSAGENLDLAVKYFDEKEKEKDYAKALDYAKKASEDANAARKLVELSKQAAALIEQAKKDIDEAKKAGAEKYAIELFNSAKDNLAKAIAGNDAKEYLKAIEFATKASEDAKAAKAACEAEKEKKVYKVSKGDCLWNISKKKDVFNDPFLWPLIYKVNTDKIKNPDLIYPNQEFKLPAGFSDKEKENAIDDAKKTPAKKKK